MSSSKIPVIFLRTAGDIPVGEVEVTPDGAINGKFFETDTALMALIRRNPKNIGLAVIIYPDHPTEVKELRSNG